MAAFSSSFSASSGQLQAMAGHVRLHELITCRYFSHCFRRWQATTPIYPNCKATLAEEATLWWQVELFHRPHQDGTPDCTKLRCGRIVQEGRVRVVLLLVTRLCSHGVPVEYVCILMNNIRIKNNTVLCIKYFPVHSSGMQRTNWFALFQVIPLFRRP